MIEIKPSLDSINEAKSMANEMGKLRNSITKGDGNIAGFLGEIMMRKYFNAEQSNTYDYDLTLPDGMTVDVKTKRTSVKPKEHYDCSIAALNTKQRCDYYAFVRVLNDYSRGWFLGLIPKEDYFKSSLLMRKGDIDPDNNFTVKTDCYNMSINNLAIYSKHEKYL